MTSWLAPELLLNAEAETVAVHMAKLGYNLLMFMLINTGCASSEVHFFTLWHCENFQATSVSTPASFGDFTNRRHRSR